MTSQWVEYDAILLPLVEQFGTSWKIIAKHLPKKISIQAARNRWMRLNPKKKRVSRNKCKLCGQPKLGHNWVTCKRLREGQADEADSHADRLEEKPDAQLGTPISNQDTCENEQFAEPVFAQQPSCDDMSENEDLKYSTLFTDIDHDSLKGHIVWDCGEHSEWSFDGLDLCDQYDSEPDQTSPEPI